MGLMAALGVVLCWQYFRFEAGLVRGVREFAYWPMPLEPLPFAPMRGFTYEQLARHLSRLTLLGPALVALSMAVASLGLVRPLGERALRRCALGLSVGGLVLCALVLCGGVMLFVLQGRVIVDDEITYRLQASLLSEGRLADPDLPPFQGDAFQVWTNAGLTGKYLFGEPLVQLPGFLLGIPALLHLLLAAVTLRFWYLGVRMQAGVEVAAWATMLLAVSPLFLLTSAVGLSHTTSLCCVVLAGYGLVLMRQDRPWAGVLIAANAIGFCAAVRPQVAGPVGIVLACAALGYLIARRQWAPLAGFAGCGAAWLGLLLAYNWALTGSPLTLPWALYLPIEHYGFGYVWEHEGYRHSVWKAFENLGVSLLRFNGWWLGWPASLALVGAWLWWDHRAAAARLWLCAGAVLALFNFAYYSPGISETGPIYYFEWLLPAAVVGGYALTFAHQRWGGATVATVAVHLALGTTTFLAENVARLDRLATLINSPAERVLAHVEPPALLFYEGAAEESLHVGWVFAGFPKIARRDSDPVVIYPRSYAKANDAIRERYAARRCYYTRVNQTTRNRELHRCEQVEGLVARRGWDIDGSPLFYVSTATRLGLISPMLSLRDRYLARLSEPERAPTLPLALIRRNPGRLESYDPLVHR
jgi:hypothetical protein